MKKILLIIVLLLTGYSISYAQLNNVGTIIQSGTADANLLAKSYLDPLGKGFGADLNSGWFNTAKTHKTLGFDITLRAGLAMIPSSDKTFDAVNLPFQRLKYASGPTMSPTIMGPKQSGTTFDIQETINNTTYNLGSFTMPKGTGIGFVPAPMIQAGVGIVHNTDLILRFLPVTKVGKFGSFNLWGIGVKEGINQYLPEGKLLPVDLSVLVGYTKFQANAGLNVQPQIDANTVNSYSSSTWNGQEIKTETSAWNANIIVGKTLPFISVFAGLGYEASSMSITSPGNYPLTVPDPTINNPNQKKIDEIVEPLNVKLDGANSVMALVGLRLNLAFFNITGSYTLAKYSLASVGVGFSFR